MFFKNLFAIIVTTIYLFQIPVNASSKETYEELVQKCEQALANFLSENPVNPIEIAKKSGEVVRKGKLPWAKQKQISIAVGEVDEASHTAMEFIDAIFDLFSAHHISSEDVSEKERIKLQNKYAKPILMALSQLLLDAGIPHKIVYTRNALFVSNVILYMDAPNISNPQTELEKFILEMDKRGVQVIYNMNLGAMAGAAYISSAEYLPPEETTISQVFRKKGQQDYVDQNRMIQLPLLSIKDRNLLSTGVAHELRHLENNERQTRKEEFAFYGHLLSPLGSPFAKDKDLVQLRTADASTAIYSKFLSMDELDTFSHFYSDLLKVIENPESKSYQIEDYKLLAHLNSFSKTGLGVSIIAQKLADYINDKMKEQKEGSKENSSIRFFYDDRYDFYWLEYIDILNSKLFIFNLPIVKSQKGSSREVLLIMISDQMKLLKEYAIAKEKLFRAALDIDKHVDLESRCSRQQIISGLSLLSDANVHSDTFFTNSSDLFVTEGATPCD